MSEASLATKIGQLARGEGTPTAPAEAAEALRSASPSAAGWYWSAPPAEFLHLIGLVEETGSRPDWVRTWAQRRMLSAGHASERLFALAWGEEGKLR